MLKIHTYSQLAHGAIVTLTTVEDGQEYPGNFSSLSACEAFRNLYFEVFEEKKKSFVL